MALNTTSFVDGAVATVEKGYELQIDLDGEGFEFLCNIGLSESLNPETISWKELCAEGGTATIQTGQDYTIAIDAKVRKSQLTDELVKRATDFETLSNIPVQLDNTLSDIRRSFNGTILIDSIGGGEGELISIQGEIKTSDGIVNSETPIPVEILP